MKVLKRSMSLLLASLMTTGLMTAIPKELRAASPVTSSYSRAAGSYYVRDINGNIEYYSDPYVAWYYAIGCNGTFGMNADWYSDFCRTVPEKHYVTVELNGHVLSRGRGKGADIDDGEVFCVESGAKLWVFGGYENQPSFQSDLQHNLKAYTTQRDEDFKYETVTFYGGVIHGGNSENSGGGIHMKQGSEVYLYYTTVAGNYADEGYGGGVMMKGTNCYLYMDHSAISHNYANDDGGGVYVNNDRCRIEMVKSSIDHNISDDNGGGIFVDAEYFTITGDAKQILNPESVSDFYSLELGSRISDNYVVDSDLYEGGGGGIYINDDKAVIRGLNFVGNEADDTGDGGAIYIKEETVLVSECNIVKNKADDLGGGIMNYNDLNTIENCTIYENRAEDGGGAGGGVYTSCYNDIAISGTTIIRKNHSKDHDADNLYLAGYASSGTTAYVIPSLTQGADVHIRLSSNHMDRVSVTGTYRADQFSYDNDSEYYIEWNEEDRALKRKKGSKPVKTVDTFIPDSGKTTQSVSGGYTVNGTEYELIRGVMEYPAFDDTSVDLESVFYYSDGYFMGDSHAYNEHLATMSLCLAVSAGYSNKGGVENEQSYLDKSNNFRQLMSDIGCKDEDIYVNDFNMVKPTPDTIGVGIASKTLPDGRTLVIIGVRGIGYESEWVSNMTLGPSGEAEGWSKAATQVMTELELYLRKKGIVGTSSDTLFWIAGYSRAGATSNLTAKRMVDLYDPSGDRIFAYPLEAPRGGVESAKKDGSDYSCIHNVINQNDIVPWVGTKEMGLIRYGVDHYVPGNPTSSAANTAWNVSTDKDSNYYKQREKMKKQLKSINSNIIFDDYFHCATVNYILGDFVSENSDYSWSTESFIALFFEKLQEYCFSYAPDPRSGYAEVAVYNGKTFQEAAAVTASLLFSKKAEDVAGLTKCLSDLVDNLSKSEKLFLYGTISKFKRLGVNMSVVFEDTDVTLARAVSKMLWNKLTNLSADDYAKGCHSIAEYLTEEEMAAFSSCFDTLFVPLLVFVAEDYDRYNQCLLGTLIHNMPRIISNHYPEVTHAWLRSYDSFFAGETTAITMDPSVKKAPSGVAVKLSKSSGEERIITDVTSDIELDGDELMSLLISDEYERDRGAAIYYHFTSGQEEIQNLHAYCYPLFLISMYDTYATGNVFSIDVVVTHYDHILETQTVRFRLAGTASIETLESVDMYGEENYAETILDVNEDLALTGCPPGFDADDATIQFVNWEVYERIGGELSETPLSPSEYVGCFGAAFDPYSENTTIRNLTCRDFRFVPKYNIVIHNMTIEMSNDTASCVYKGILLGDELPVSWSYEGDYLLGTITLTLPENYSLALDARVSINHYDAPGAPTKESITKEGDRYQIAIRVENPEHNWFTDPKTYMDVIAIDANTNQELGRARVHSPWSEQFRTPITVSAPVYPNMVFTGWEEAVESRIQNGGSLQDTSVTLSRDGNGESNTVRAYYQPVVSKVKVVLDQDISAGNAFPELEQFVATINDDWQIENAELTWSSDDSTAGYNTVYTAHIRIDKATMRGRDLSQSGSASVSLTGKVFLGKDIYAEVLDSEGNALSVTATYFSTSDAELCLDIVFAETGNMKVESISDVRAFVEHDSSESQILSALDRKVRAYLSDGSIAYIPVSWERADAIDPDDSEAQTIYAYGSLSSSIYDVSSVGTVKATVLVLAEEQARAPLATPASGDYIGARYIELAAEKDAKIFYAIVKVEKENEEYPDSSDLQYQEYTAPIYLNDYEQVNYIFAYAEKDGLADSDVTSFRYNLTKPVAKHFAGEPATIARSGLLDCWYSTWIDKRVDPDTGDITEIELPYAYYADEDCSILLDYDEDVVIPPFYKSLHEAKVTSDSNLTSLGFGEETTFLGLQTIGVQSISHSPDVRVITVVDSRILRDATDYGYLFSFARDGKDDLTVANAPFRYSCAGTTNDMADGMGDLNLSTSEYKYVTARVNLGEKPVLARFYVRLEDGTEYIYGSTYRTEETIGSDASMDVVTDNITFDATNGPLFVGHSLSLDGSIGVKFYLDLTEEEAAKTTVTFYWFNKVMNDVPVEEDPNGSGYYIATCDVAAAEMTYDILAKVKIDGIEQEETNIYSVKRYADVILSEEYENSYTGNKPYADLKNLVLAMLDYGARSQIRFDRNTDKLANEGDYTFTDEVPMDALPEMWDMHAGLSEFGLEYTGATLVFLTDTSLRLYYKITDQDKFDRVKDSVTFNDEPVTYTVKGEEIYFELKNIPAHCLDTAYPLRIGDKYYYYSALNYARAHLEKDPEEANILTQDLVRAMYYYNEMADTYYDD